MKKMNFTFHSLKWMALSLLLTTFGSNVAQAQAGGCQLTCNDEIQVSVNQWCEAWVSYDMVLEDPDNPAHCSPNGPSAYVVLVMNSDGTPRDEPVITCEDVGEECGASITVKVKHWASGNSCWATVIVEDKLPPVVEAEDQIIWCNQDPYDPAFIPTVADNCSGDVILCAETAALFGVDTNLGDDADDHGCDISSSTLCLEDEIWEDLDCDDDFSAKLTRIWLATDHCGNWVRITQMIFFDRLELCVGFDEHWDCIPNPEITLPGDTEVDCDEPCADAFRRICDGTATDADISATYACAGFPTKKDEFLGESEYYFCELAVSHHDKCITVCDNGHMNSFKVLREWKILDWCTGDILEYTQIIKVVDEETNIICDPTPIEVNTNVWGECAWHGVIPPAQEDENCGWADVVTEVWGFQQHGHQSVYGLIERIPGNGGVLSQPLYIDGCTGSYDIVYEISDNCHNHASCTRQLVITDNVAPTPVCDETTQVTIDAFPQNGEFDTHCFTDGLPYTILPNGTRVSNADVNCDGGAKAVVYARTFDDGSHDNCTEDLTFEVRRMDGGSYGPFVEFFCEDSVDEDGDGQCDPVMVLFRVTDECGNVSEPCMVEVIVDEKTPPTITCPEPITINCTDINDATDPDQIWLFIDDNGLLNRVCAQDNCGIDRIEGRIRRNNIEHCNIGDITLSFTAFDKACPSPNTSQRCDWTITLEDPTPLTVSFPIDCDLTCDDIAGGVGTEPSELPAGCDTISITGDDCELIAVNHFDEIFPIADNACFKILRRWVVINWCVYDANGPQDPSNGYYSHIQVIVVSDEDAPIVADPIVLEDVCILDDDCDADVVICRPDVSDCVPDEFIEVSFTFQGVEYFITDDCVTIPDVAKGTYEVRFTISDNCGNAVKRITTVKVDDCKKPTPYCANGLVIELMPTTGMVTTWAVDFDRGSFDNCTAQGDLIFSLSSDPSDDQLDLSCEDLGTQTVQLWVTDECGNQDFCETFVIVQDNMGGCESDPGNGGLATGGTITTEMSENVSDVMVSVNGQMTESLMTDASGVFNFSLPANGDYSITAERDDNPLNGVSTFDLVKMRKHILGVEYLDTPYKMIAADINNSASISTFDMVELRKVILQVNTTFTNNTSWRFVDADYTFVDAANPWAEAFPEVINYNDYTTADLAADFVAVKIGDLNDSATPNALVSGDDRSSNGQLVFNVADQAVKAGETYTVEFAADLTNVEGYQFTLNFDKNAVQLADIVEGVAKAENFGTTLVSEGAITTSWNGEAADQAVFSLTFKALANAQLSDVLAIGSRYTTAEAYTKGAELLDVAISFSEGTVATAGFELYQNTPNPFSTVTNISFDLPEAGAATLNVHDVTGKVIATVKGEYAKGYNQISISKAQLNATGVLYYTLETADATATRKMIVIK